MGSRWAHSAARIPLAVTVVVVSVACAAPGSAPTSDATGTHAPSGSATPVAPSATRPSATPGAPATGSPAPAPTATTAAPRSFTVIGSGDILLHAGLWRQAARDAAARGTTGYDFDPIFASVAPAVSRADLAICHIESPFGPANGPFSAFPAFSVPPQVATTIAKIGYDTCSTASNHSLDVGEAGIDRTLDALDRVGVRHAGTARSAAEAATPTILMVRGVRVAHLSYSFGFNGVPRPEGKPWVANLLDPQTVLSDAHRARRAGAEVVIVSLHWGTEYSHNLTGQQTSVARRLLASPDIDLILGHHAHVVQPLERIGGKWVAYGLGNEVAYQNFSDDTTDGIMPRFTFTETRPGVFRVTKADVLPIHMWLGAWPVRLYDVAACRADPRVPATVRSSCTASRERTADIIGLRGASQAGLVLD